MTFKNILFAAMALVATTACSGNSANADETLSTDSVVYKLSDKMMNVDIVFDYPTSGNDILRNSIAEYISEELGGKYMGNLENKDSLMQFYAEDSRKYLKTSLDEMDGYDGPELELSAKVRKSYENDKFVTYETTTYEYLGGAHGFETVTGTTIRKSDGRRFGSEILINKDNEKFYALLKEGLKQYLADSEGSTVSDQQLQEAIMTDAFVDCLPMPQHTPYLTEDGVKFVYQPYEIFCYAAGTPSFTIPYDKIRPFLSAAALKLISE